MFPVACAAGASFFSISQLVTRSSRQSAFANKARLAQPRALLYLYNNNKILSSYSIIIISTPIWRYLRTGPHSGCSHAAPPPGTRARPLGICSTAQNLLNLPFFLCPASKLRPPQRGYYFYWRPCLTVRYCGRPHTASSSSAYMRALGIYLMVRVLLTPLLLSRLASKLRLPCRRLYPSVPLRCLNRVKTYGFNFC